MDEAEYIIPANILRHFDLSFTPYDDERVTTILARRRAYPGGKLFVDQLLQHAEVDSVSLYPPTSPAAYRRLLALIHASPLDRLKRDCLYYVLLKDYTGSNQEDDGSYRAEEFAKARGLSKTWRVFMDGYWDLDNGRWESAITNLTNPAITEVNFPSDIVSTLATQCSPPTVACSLIHTFLLTRIPLPSADNVAQGGVVDLYTTALASASGVPSAFSYIRSLDPAFQSHLREVVWAWSLGAPLAPCGLPSALPMGEGEPNHAIQQAAIKEILHLPLLPEEDDHLLSFLLSPPKSAPLTPDALSLLHDLVTLRLIHQGKYAESLQLDRELAGSGGGKEDDRQRRREMVREFIAILPEAQRRALALGGGPDDGRDTEVTKMNGVIDLDAEEELPASATAIPFPLEPPAPTPPTTAAVASPAPGPAARVVSTSTNSPFSGPPRFAPNPNLPLDSPRGRGGTPVQRVLSGSPFTLPMSKGANAVRSASFSRPQTPTQQVKALPIPRPKSRPIEPELEEEEASVRRVHSRQEAMDVDHQPVEGDPAAEQEPPAEVHEEEEELVNEGEADIIIEQPAASPTPTVPTPRQAPTRRSKRTTTVSPPPQAPAPARRSSRQTSVPASAPASTAPTSPSIHHLPGTFTIEPVPEDRPLQSTSAGAGDMTRSRTRRQLSAAPDPPPPASGAGRSRMTRSASRATLGDPDDPPPAAKRARSRRLSAASEMNEMTPAPTPRRTTRRGGKEEQSERGSPTPSVAASVGGRTTRATSQTPRKSTRTRK